jgi:hypothetical protein
MVGLHGESIKKREEKGKAEGRIREDNVKQKKNFKANAFFLLSLPFFFP